MFSERKDSVVVSENLKKIRDAFNYLAKKHAPNIEILQEIEFSDGSMILNNLQEKKSDKKSDIPVKNGKMEILFNPWPDSDDDKCHLTQAAIHYLAKRLNSLVKDEKEAINCISAFIVMFINEEKLLTGFGKDLRKKFQEIPFLQTSFNLTKYDLLDENVEKFVNKTLAYQDKLESEMNPETEEDRYMAFFN